MKVRELITRLQAMPQEAEVVTSYDGNPMSVDTGPRVCWVTTEHHQLYSGHTGTWMRWGEEGQPLARRVVQI
jgi:hypothetical protein